MLAICDAERPVAVAGIMGGGDTEVSDATRTVLLESAHFNPLSVRRTARALGLRTEASHRFERVVDPAAVVAASDRACSLVQTLGLGEVVPGVIDVYPSPTPLRSLALRADRVSELLGIPVTAEAAADALQRLGFDVLQADGAMRVAVPTWRADVVREIDLVEEVGRVVGYERLPERLPAGATLQGGDSEWWLFEERVRDVLVGMGLQEVVCHSLLAPGPFEDPRDVARRIGIRSALSAELSGLRRSLLPGLVDALDRNARRGQGPLALFEIGHVFHAGADGYQETHNAGAILCGPISTSGWHRGGTEPADFYTARGIVESICEALHVEQLSFSASGDPRLHPGRSARVKIGERYVGYIGELHPDLAADLHVRDRVIVLALSLEPLKAAAGAGTRYTPVSPYPAVARDLAPRVAEEVPYAQVYEAAVGTDVDILERLDLADVYRGAPLPPELKSFTLSFTFRAPDRTLTEEEVNAALSRIRAALESMCGATFAG